jgi:hypothetical protein
VLPSTSRPIEAPGLAAADLPGRRDGDRFWLIATGSGERMPAFAGTLDEPDIWALVDFLRASADARRMRRVSLENARIPAPTFTCEAADGSSLWTGDLAGRVLYVLFSASDDRAREFAWADLGDDINKILVPLGADVAQDMPLCFARDPTVPLVFGRYLAEGPQALDGVALIVDAAGYIRSLRPARFAADAALIRRLLKLPPAARAAPGHHH